MLSIAVFGVLLIRLLYIFTYPLNNAGGDTSTYYFMLINRTTNLIHASGYPFIVGSVARFLFGPGDVSSPTYSFAVLAIQHSIEVITLGVIALLVHRLFDLVTALFFLLLAGCSVFAMSWTSATYPEWLQSCLLLISLFLVAGAICSKSLSSKLLLYIVAFLAFAWAYLTKYNAGLFLPLFLIPLVAEYRSIGRKAAWILLAPVPALASVFLFVDKVHLPSSGTTTLHQDVAWVLMASLGEIDNRRNVLLDDPGPYALQWLAMSAILPRAYDRARAWPRIDEPPKPGEEEIAAKFKAEFVRLSKMSPEELKVFLNEHPLPKEFILGSSAIPFYEFVGLAPSDKLGTKVFLEYVSRHPIVFIRSTLRKSIKYALTDLTISLVPGPIDGLTRVEQPTLASGFALYSSTLLPWKVRYQSRPAMLFWEPGVTLFRTLQKWQPRPWLEVSCSILSLVWAMAVTIRRRRLTLGPGIVFTLAIALPALVVASNIILILRDKEVRALWPLACLFWAIGIGSIAQEILRWLSGTVRTAHVGDIETA